MSFSTNGNTYSAPLMAYAATEDDVQENRDDRIFAGLVFVDGASFIRYRVLDQSGHLVRLNGLEITYIDASAGPQSGKAYGSAALTELTEPAVISRAGWGADESYRFDQYGEIWPREYQFVEHVIVHHTATPNGQDPFLAIRSIYYYHAVERGWGDIGYNYLVDSDGISLKAGPVGTTSSAVTHSNTRMAHRASPHWVRTSRCRYRRVSGRRWSRSRDGWVATSIQPAWRTSSKSEASHHLWPPRHERQRVPGRCAVGRLPSIRSAVASLLE